MLFKFLISPDILHEKYKADDIYAHAKNYCKR